MCVTYLIVLIVLIFFFFMACWGLGVIAVCVVLSSVLLVVPVCGLIEPTDGVGQNCLNQGYTGAFCGQGCADSTCCIYSGCGALGCGSTLCCYVVVGQTQPCEAAIASNLF